MVGLLATAEETAHSIGLRNMIEHTMQEPSKENVMSLANEIKGNRRYSDALTREESNLTDNAVAAICKIPGHAKYFADELERLRLDKNSDYRRVRAWYLADTLPHLPSPETIQVLGHYLDDERDTPADEMPGFKELVQSGKFRDDQAYLPENARLAAYALSNIGLRETPCTRLSSYGDSRGSYWANCLPSFRDWYREVKAGTRSFSFAGQKVEYRFKPDGSWDTFAMANQQDKSQGKPQAGAVNRPVKPRLVDDTHEPRPTKPLRWLWLGSAVVAILGLLAWILTKRTKA
jgi:hypothetical protein